MFCHEFDMTAIGKQRELMRSLFGALATGVVSGAFIVAGSIANAATVDVSAWGGQYDDTGTGMAVTGAPTATGAFQSATSGFFYEWGLAGSVGGYSQYDVFSAFFTGKFDAVSAGTYSISFGSDDAGYLFVDGGLAISDSGIHGYMPAYYDVTLNAGENSFKIEMGNSQCCESNVGVYVPAGVTISGVPEAATWTMMLFGFAGLGFVGYRKHGTRGGAQVDA